MTSLAQTLAVRGNSFHFLFCRHPASDLRFQAFWPKETSSCSPIAGWGSMHHENVVAQERKLK